MFARSLYLGAGPIIAVLALLGMALALYRRDRHAWVLPLTWLAASYIWSTYLANVPGNNQRYAFYAMPAVAFFAAYGLWHFADRRVLRWAWAGTLLLAVGLHGASAVRTPHRYVSGYEAAARLVHGLPNSGAILFAGKHDGNFVFHLRQLDRDRQRVVLRGDKTLVSMSVHKYFGIRSNVSDAADIKTLLNGHGVRWIVVESRDLVGLKEFRLLHETLRGPGFRLVATVPVTTNVAEFTDVNVLVYENLALQLPDSGRVRINFPYLGKSYDFTFPDPATN
jgi:hypothetical protein